jgi:hypothetical protein
MPKFGAIPPTADTTGEGEEIVTDMMSEAHRLLSTS